MYKIWCFLISFVVLLLRHYEDNEYAIPPTWQIFPLIRAASLVSSHCFHFTNFASKLFQAVHSALKHWLTQCNIQYIATWSLALIPQYAVRVDFIIIICLLSGFVVICHRLLLIPLTLSYYITATVEKMWSTHFSCIVHCIVHCTVYIINVFQCPLQCISKYISQNVLQRNNDEIFP